MADDNQVNVSITANSEGVESGVNAAADAVDSGTQRMIELLERLTTVSEVTEERIKMGFEGMSESAEKASEHAAESEAGWTGLFNKIKESVTESQEQLEGFAKGIQKIQGAFALLAEVAALGFIGEQIADLAKEFAEFGEQTEIAAQKSGMTTTAVQELGFAAKMTGVSAEGMNQGLMRLSRAMTAAEGGSKPLQASFEALGISAKSLEGMSVDQVLEKIADKFASTEDGAVKAGIAMQLFGRSGSDLIPLLDKGSDGINELRQKAEDLGLVMGGEDIEAASKLNEQLKQMDAQMAAVKLRAGSELAPAFVSIVSAMALMDEKGGALDEMFTALGAVLKGVVTVAIMAGAAFDTLANVIVTAGAAFIEVVEGNYKQAVTQIQIGAQDIYNAASKAQEALDKMWDAAKEGESIDMGEGGNDWSEKGKLAAPDASGSQGPSQVELWKEQLQEQEEASGQYFKNNLKDEEAFWEQKLALVKSGSKDYIAIEHELYQIKSELAHQDLAEDLAAMHEQMATAESGSIQKIQIASQEAERIGQAYGFQSAQYKAALAEMLKAGKEYSDAQVQLVADGIARQEQQLLAGVSRDEAAQKAKFKAHQESSAQETAALISDENQRYAIESDAIEKEMALYDQDSKQYQKLLDQKLKATEDHTTALAKINEQGAQQTQQQWEQAFRSIDSSVNSSIMGMIKGTTTLQQAMTKIADQILDSMIKVVLQMAERWIAGEAQKIAASQAASAVLQALGLQDAATALVTQTASATQQIASEAAIGGAGAYAATAAIPLVGPALAPAAGMEAYTAIMAFEGMGSYAGGNWNVDADQIAQIHQNEMVLPVWAAQGMRNMIGSPGAAAGGGGGGGHTFNNNMTVNNSGLTDANFRAMALRHADVLTTAVKGQLRNFQR
jgi:hypothetical protein